jgi:glycosyltransferase involved in cell wall biosynthesis
LTFVRAVAVARRAVPDLHGVMVGEGRLRRAVEHEIRDLQLEDVLHLTGYRTDADAILSAATVAALSSQHEGLGTVLLDAMSFGIPIVATSAGGIPEIVENGVSGLLAPIGDAEALGAAIAQLVREPTLAARLIAAARHRVEEFSVAQMVEKTAEVYRRVLAG